MSNISKTIFIALAVVLLGLILEACGDTSSTTVTTDTPTSVSNSGTVSTVVTSSTTRSELSPASLPTFTPASTGSVTTPTAVSVGNPASVLADNTTSCGKIPYYTAPKLDPNGKVIGPVYTAIGASDTVGTGSTMPRTDSWVVQLYNKLPKSYQFVRLGIGGLTLHEATQCFLTRAIASNPTLISDWNVVNDIVRGVSLDSYKTDLDYLLQQLTSQTNAKIVVGNVPDLNTLPFVVRILGNNSDLTQLTKNWNALISQEVAKYSGRVYLVNLQTDVASFKQHPEWLSGDGLHPTAAGYTQIAQAYWNVITADKLVQSAS